jgi:hypothetical protein
MFILKEIKASSGCEEKTESWSKKMGEGVSWSIFVFRYRRLITLWIHAVHLDQNSSTLV